VQQLFNNNNASKHKSKQLASIVVAALIVFAAMLIMRLLTGTFCVFHGTLGLPCPGCGLTRAYTSLFQGNIADAFRYHPLFWSVPVIFGLWIHSYFWTDAGGKWRKPLMAGLLVALGVLFIVRMILFFPHTEPMVINSNALLQRLIGLFG